jgi:hypothetical protein
MKGYGLDRAGSGLGQETGNFECGNEISGSLKCGEIREWMKIFLHSNT